MADAVVQPTGSFGNAIRAQGEAVWRVVLPVLTVVAAILAFWYVACIPMNMHAALTDAERAGIAVRPEGVFVLIHSRDGSLRNQADVAVIGLSFGLNTILGRFGSSVSPAEGTPGSFFGPVRFLAEANELMTIADTSDDGSVARVVQFDPMSGSGWRDYGRGPNLNQTDDRGEFVFATYDTGLQQ